jgi:hypothetical protein
MRATYDWAGGLCFSGVKAALISTNCWLHWNITVRIVLPRFGMLETLQFPSWSPLPSIPLHILKPRGACCVRTIALALIDRQEKLLPPIFEKERLVRNAQWRS